LPNGSAGGPPLNE